MTHEEKNTIAHLLSTAVVMGACVLFLNQMLGADALSRLGRTILLVVIGGGIVTSIVAAILVNIVLAIAANDPSPSMATDERDKLIQLKSMTLATYGLGVGFVLSMVALALGQSAFVVINLIVFSGALADILGSVVKIVIYRRGF